MVQTNIPSSENCGVESMAVLFFSLFLICFPLIVSFFHLCTFYTKYIRICLGPAFHHLHQSHSLDSTNVPYELFQDAMFIMEDEATATS